MANTSNIAPKAIKQYSSARIAVSLIFMMSGFNLGNWAPKIPFIIESLHITEASMGNLLLLVGLGGLVMMPISSYLVSKFGTRGPTLYLATFSSLSLLLITLAPDYAIAGVAMFLAGIFIIGMDIAMNSNVLVVEKKQKINFMSSCHGWWSVGGIIGSLTAGTIIQHIGIFYHVVYVTLSCLVMVGYSWSRILKDRPAEPKVYNSFTLPRKPTIYLLGIMCFMAILPEGAIIDWGALYLINELGSSTSAAGYAFAAMSASMALVRFLGDFLKQKYGSVSIMRASCVIGAAGMIIGGQATSMVVAMVGFAIAGVGIANLVPIIISAAGKQDDVSASVGISTVGFMSSIGLMSAPALLGYAAEVVSFSLIFTLTSIAFIFVFLLSPLTQKADEK